jgi:hypothetical protein
VTWRTRPRLTRQFSHGVQQAACHSALGQYNAVLAKPAFTFLETTKNFNADFLITYLLHPGTALYVGYNSNLENVQLPLRNDVDGNLLHSGRLKNDGRGLFVKASYLFRFWI